MADTSRDPDASGTIVVEYDLDATPDRVWTALTEPALIERWLMPTDFAPVVGRPFTFRTDPAPGFDGVIRGEVTRVEPNERLSYSWRSGPADTLVAWQLEPADGGGTHARLTQTGFRPEEEPIREMLEGGWRTRSGDRLKELVATL